MVDLIFTVAAIAGVSLVLGFAGLIAELFLND